MRRLTVQGNDRPLRDGHTRFPEALAALAERAARPHRNVLAAAVPRLSWAVEWTTESLRGLPTTPVTAIHGGLVPPNIHVDDAADPAAVLDFGSFPTAGDPALEAAVTAAIWDMYGPGAEHHTAELTNSLTATAVRMVVDQLPEEFAPCGVRVKAVSPGPVRTPGWTDDGRLADGVVAAFRVTRERAGTRGGHAESMGVSLGGMGEDDEIVAAAVAFLLGPDARWITGKAYSDQFEASVDR